MAALTAKEVPMINCGANWLGEPEEEEEAPRWAMKGMRMMAATEWETKEPAMAVKRRRRESKTKKE